MASYPGATVSFSTVAMMDFALFDDTADEIEAVENECGIQPQGTRGSIAERVLMFMDSQGNPHGNISLKHNLASTNKRSSRNGVEIVELKTADEENLYVHKKSITFEPALQTACHAFVFIQLADPAANIQALNIPMFANYVEDTGTTTGFDVRFGTQGGQPAPNNSTCLLHWWAIEKSLRTSTQF